MAAFFCVQLVGYFLHVLGVVRGYFALVEGIGLCWEDELHMFMKIIILHEL